MRWFSLDSQEPERPSAITTCRKTSRIVLKIAPLSGIFTALRRYLGFVRPVGHCCVLVATSVVESRWCGNLDIEAIGN